MHVPLSARGADCGEGGECSYRLDAVIPSGPDDPCVTGSVRQHSSLSPPHRLFLMQVRQGMLPVENDLVRLAPAGLLELDLEWIPRSQKRADPHPVPATEPRRCAAPS